MRGDTRWGVSIGRGPANLSVYSHEYEGGYATKLEAIAAALVEAEYIRRNAAQSIANLKRMRRAEIRKASKAEACDG